jgi:hypothetical protein
MTSEFVIAFKEKLDIFLLGLYVGYTIACLISMLHDYYA